MVKLLPYYKMNPAISIWISWYKKSSKTATDITANPIREQALKQGLVYIKVYAERDLEWIKTRSSIGKTLVFLLFIKRDS